MNRSRSQDGDGATGSWRPNVGDLVTVGGRLGVVQGCVGPEAGRVFEQCIVEWVEPVNRQRCDLVAQADLRSTTTAELRSVLEHVPVVANSRVLFFPSDEELSAQCGVFDRVLLLFLVVRIRYLRLNGRTGVPGHLTQGRVNLTPAEFEDARARWNEILLAIETGLARYLDDGAGDEEGGDRARRDAEGRAAFHLLAEHFQGMWF